MSEGLLAALWRWARTGFLHGALLYGATISLLHVFHNRVPSVRDALVLLAVSVVIYGLVSTAVFVGAGLVARIGARWLPKSANPRMLGFFVFTFVFWFFYFNYALSYDKVPFVADPDIRHMLVYVVLRGLAIAVVAWWISRAVDGLLSSLGRAGVLGRTLAAASVVVLAVHVAAGVVYAPPAPPSVSLEEAPQAASAEAPTKVVLLGIDGAEWHVIDKLFARGELPNLHRFVDEGVSGPMHTIRNANSPLIWASIYSGKLPASHGVQDFYTLRFPGMSAPGIFPVHRTYFKEIVDFAERFGLAQRTTVDRSSIRSVLLWETAFSMGRSIGVVDGYYYSFPVPQLGDAAKFFFAYGTNDYVEQVDEKDRDEGVSSLFAFPPALVEQQSSTLRGGDLEWQSKTLLAMLERSGQPDFVNLYTHEPDASQHWYWKWFEPKYYLGVTPEDEAQYGNVVPDVYRSFDRFLGELLERIDDDTVVMIISDHGHIPCILHRRMYTWHRHGPPGVVLMRGGPVRRGFRVDDAHVLDVYPTVLHLLGVPVPEDGAGKVLTEAFEPQWNREHPVHTVPSYDFLRSRFEALAGQSSGTRNERELERLKNLGYIG